MVPASRSGIIGVCAPPASLYLEPQGTERLLALLPIACSDSGSLMDSSGSYKGVMASKDLELPSPVAGSRTTTHSRSSSSRRRRVLLAGLVSAVLLGGSMLGHLPKPPIRSGWLLPFASSSYSQSSFAPDNFFHTSTPTDEICPSVANASSYSGWIGLEGDSDDSPKRSFYWYEDWSILRSSVADNR